ncbi:hypothetical protein ANCCAN_10050 [Ancylostoma caninum]|uniref:Uncharacterized protein n=1 Tax=Ancylostoma caninum TaxID=29170 RepID=A0A368GLT6_ANCCA|nr:hypothetical protein ANCCAN_10050 [Ancylostoma caninum]
MQKERGNEPCPLARTFLLLNIHLRYLQALKHADLFSDFHGFILTGWQRYDHFASLCELLPVSIASLAINIKLIRNFVLTDVDAEVILRSLKCPADTTINELIAGEAKCHFPGYKVRDSIWDFMIIKHHYDNASWIHNRESAYLQRSQMYLNASNPFYVDAVGNSYRKYLERLDKIMDRLRTSMNDIFFKDVFVEFMTDYVNPFYDDLKARLASVDTIDRRKTYRARPWFQK